ncbi:MAG TPA: helix-turn-helix domain-containing protein [Ramlibacter sp.]
MTDVISHPGLPPLPPALAAAFAAATSGGGKRERTQSALVRAAVQVFCARGVAAATVQEVAQVAGMTAGTVYNHFASKEELLERVVVVLAQSLCRAIADSVQQVEDGAERLAIGQRRYVLLAAESPAWALLLLDIAASGPSLLQQIEAYPLADLRHAVRQKRLKVPSEAVAMDVLTGICQQAMRRVAAGQAPARHDVALATVVLRALGMPPEEAAEVARRPLPELPMPQERQPAARASRKPVAARKGR